MNNIRFLDWPMKRYYGETHVFHRWKNLLLAQGLKVTLHYDHRDPNLLNADCLIIHSRYFAAWQNTATRSLQNEEDLLAFLARCKKMVNRLIWFDAADSTGSADLMLLPYVDLFLKKQLLRDKNLYVATKQKAGLRVWLQQNELKEDFFVPSDKAQLEKLRLGWNIGLNDYRYFGYKMSRLSNYVGYGFYPLKFTQVLKARPLDVVFRGTLHQDANGQHPVAVQRNKVLNLFKSLNRKIPEGMSVGKRAYWRELRNARLGISPYGWGEICYRDFELMISGCLLIKPDMRHIDTYPNLYLENETYIAVRWDLEDLEDQLNELLDHYHAYLNVAVSGQEQYKKAYMDGEGFVNHFKQAIS